MKDRLCIIGLGVSFVCALTGCFATSRPVFETGGAKLPTKIGVCFSAVDEVKQDLETLLRPAVIEALHTGFMEVLEINSAPPYDEKSLKNAGIEGVVCVNLEGVKRSVPIVLQIEGFRVTFNVSFSIYGPTASVIESGKIEGYAKEATLVITSFSGEGKWPKLSENAARDVANQLLEKTYKLLGKNESLVPEKK